jgi:hypothetical protein
METKDTTTRTARKTKTREPTTYTLPLSEGLPTVAEGAGFTVTGPGEVADEG